MTTVRATARPRPTLDPFQPVWRLLTSVRFAVMYIAVLAGLGLLGVLIPQVPEAMRGNDAAVDAWLDTHRGTFGPLTDPMHRAGLFSLFQAKWFLAALGFLVLNVTVCTFNRWSPTFRNVFHPPERVPDSFFDRAHNRTALAPVDADDAVAVLRSMRFGVRTREEGGATYVFADRYGWAQLATFVSHLALILFLAGGLITSLTGFSTDAFAGEGTTWPVFAVKDPGQMQVRIDDAIGVYGEKGNPIDFRTHLTIFRNGELVKSGVATVNDPLEYRGYRFHQVAFFPSGASLRVREVATGNTVFHETFALEDTTAAPAVTITGAEGDVLLADVITPTDFLEIASGSTVMIPGRDGIFWVGVTTRGDAWELVAYDPRSSDSTKQLRLLEGESGELSGMRVTFDRIAVVPSALGMGIPGSANAVLAQLDDAPGGGKTLTLVASDRPAITLAEGDPVVSGAYEYTFEGPRQFAGISVKRDHGAWFIWVATGMLLIGLAVTFYVPRRRLWLKLTPARTQIAALAEKSGGFEKDMRILARRLRVDVPPELQEER